MTFITWFDVRWLSDSIGMARRDPNDNRSPDSRGPEGHVVIDDPTRSVEV